MQAQGGPSRAELRDNGDRRRLRIHILLEPAAGLRSQKKTLKKKKAIPKAVYSRKRFFSPFPLEN